MASLQHGVGLGFAQPRESADAHALGRVMVVDDSAIVRGLVARWIDEEPDLEVVGRCPNGQQALQELEKSAPDVILLDVDMPVMSGIEALPLLLRAKPGVKILMVSTLTRRNARITLNALSLGAVDYLAKPDSNYTVTTSIVFRQELIRKVRGLVQAQQRRLRRRAELESSDFAPVARNAASAAPGISLRPFSAIAPRIIAIGSSTGGPEVLVGLLGALVPVLGEVPVVVVQHMPPLFTAALAERLGRATGVEAREGEDGDVLKPGMIYVAPGDRHMTVVGSDHPMLRLSDEEPVQFCRPAVDPLFASVARSYGPAALGIVLTGMGADGAAGALALADRGGSVIAQDEASSTVWGMPAAAAATGACAALLPPLEIARKAVALIEGEAV